MKEEVNMMSMNDNRRILMKEKEELERGLQEIKQFKSCLAKNAELRKAGKLVLTCKKKVRFALAPTYLYFDEEPWQKPQSKLKKFMIQLSRLKI